MLASVFKFGFGKLLKMARILISLLAFFGIGITVIAQTSETEDNSASESALFDAFELRNIGPAFMSGRCLLYTSPSPRD